MHAFERVPYERIVPALRADPPPPGQPLPEKRVAVRDGARHVLHKRAHVRRADKRRERGLRRARRADLQRVQRGAERSTKRRRGADEAESVPRDAVRLGERKEVDERRSPVPVGRSVGGRRRSGRREEVMGRAGGNEVAVGLVDNERDVVLTREGRKGRDEAR